MQHDWKSLLTRWSKELLASPLCDSLPENVRISEWLGFPPASEDEISALETHLGTKLPVSYREFLQVTNGWRRTTNFISSLYSADQVGRLQALHPEMIEAWAINDTSTVSDEDYFVYGPEQDPAFIRAEYLASALQVSELIEGAVYLLNPKVMNKHGEWEAWFFASWLPGAQRYQSFWDLMVAEHESFLHVAGAE